ncbi:MAG: preprotein translocase subunit YajC [Methylococcales bacterium]|jgi:preprotein translocase subunit YajC|nr:preprotein translocase subunit YajC [Methylococcales bacterium]
MESLLSFFISDAHAAAGGQEPSALAGILPLVLIMVVFYFMLIRPQSKRMKEQKLMISELKKGDEIVTNGGVLAKIVNVGDNFLTVEAGEGITLLLQRQAVGALMPKGTMKEAKNV